MATVRPHTISSRLTTTAFDSRGLRARLDAAKNTFGTKALWVAAMVVPLVAGGLGFGASYFIERHRNATIAKNQKNVLVNNEHIKREVAALLGIDPGKVGVRELEMAARLDPNNPSVAGLVNRIKKEEGNANRSSAFAAAGASAVGVATGGLGFLPGAAGAAHFVASEGLKMGGAVAGGAVSSVFDKAQLEPLDVIASIEEKVSAGIQIMPHDVALLRIAQNAGWQQTYKKQHGHSFHSLTAEQQQKEIEKMPDMFEVPDKVLYAVNKGLISPHALLDTQIGGASSGFSDRETARRTAEVATAR